MKQIPMSKTCKNFGWQNATHQRKEDNSSNLQSITDITWLDSDLGEGKLRSMERTRRDRIKNSIPRPIDSELTSRSGRDVFSGISSLRFHFRRNPLRSHSALFLIPPFSYTAMSDRRERRQKRSGLVERRNAKRNSERRKRDKLTKK